MDPWTHVSIAYRVRPERVDEHLELLAAVFAELGSTRPGGVRWDSYRLGDGTSFLDVASLRGGGRLSRLSSWSAYRGTLDERCDEPPVLAELDLLGRYDAED
jgi:hypothetical protein